MPVDVSKKRVVLVVHGVQVSTDGDLKQDKMIRKLVERRLAGSGVPKADWPEFDCRLFKYEDINDKRMKKWKTLLKALGTAVGTVAGAVLDLVGDVVISLGNRSTAALIRRNLRDVILNNYKKAGRPLFIVAHSLGSVYAFDVLNELVKKKGLFDKQDRATWPVQGMVTIGSPLGIKLFRRRKVVPIGITDDDEFEWINYFDEQDPVVSGNVFGKPYHERVVVERFHNPDTSGWYIEDIEIDTQKPWLFAHSAYWDHPHVGDTILQMLARE